MAPLLQSAPTPSDGPAVVTMRGDLDADTAAQFWQYLSYLIGQGHQHIVLDLRGIILIDSAGIEAITRASAWTRDRGGDLVLRSASLSVAEQLELARLVEATGAIPHGQATDRRCGAAIRPGGPRARRQGHAPRPVPAAHAGHP